MILEALGCVKRLRVAYAVRRGLRVGYQFQVGRRPKKKKISSSPRYQLKLEMILLRNHPFLGMRMRDTGKWLNEANCVQAGGMSTCHWQWGASDGPGERDKAQGPLFLGTCYGTLSPRTINPHKKNITFSFIY